MQWDKIKTFRRPGSPNSDSLYDILFKEKEEIKFVYLK